MVTELNEDWKKTLESERISVVKCYSSWCGPCKFYAPHFQKIAENLSVYNDVEIKYYQSNGDKLIDFKKTYGIDRFPTTLFLVYGVLVTAIQGVTRHKIVEKMLDKSLKIPYDIKKEIK